ncbi:MAG TPA: hypothetical protein VKX41_17290 [Alloacidobacterium sp.]|jgi:hypothetical protein|nr:hypothetical protein [Alloacidobacterium sp.]
MTYDMQQLATLLLQHRNGREDFGEISHLEGRECSRAIANRFLICCLLDFQQNADVAWKKGEALTEQLGGAENVWLAISDFPREAWDSKYHEFGRPHRFHWGYARLWGIANAICTRYNGDARNIWSNRSPYDALVHLWAVGAGDQISRMIVGALRESGQIKGDSGDVKADVHLRRVLGRAVYGHEIGVANAAQIIDLTRELHPTDPWQLDWPLWILGRSNCKATDPNCLECYLRPHCIYDRQHRGTDAVESS